MLIMNQAGDEIYILSQTVLIRVMWDKVNGVETWCVNMFLAGENTYNSIGRYSTEAKAKYAFLNLYGFYANGYKAYKMPADEDGN